MSKTKLHFIATFMILLIVTMPFYIANVFAESRIDTIQYPTPSGDAQTQGFMRSTDVLTIIANIYSTSLDATKIPAQLKFGTYSFTSCAAFGQANWFNCSLVRQFTGVDPIVTKTSVKLTATDCTNCEIPVTLTVDGFAPTILEFTLYPNLTGGNEISVSYAANDKACDAPECTGYCSGIKKVTMFTDGSFSNPLKVFDVNQAPNSPNQCAISDLIKVPVNLSTGKYSLCIVASDGAGNGGYFDKVCRDLTIDREPPRIDSAKIYLGSKEALFMPQGGTLVNLTVNLTSELSKLKDIIVDLTQFGIGNQSFFNKCKNISDRWSCTHQFFLSIPFAATSVNFPIYVIDEAGNTVNYAFSQLISVDFTPPAVSSIRTNYVWNNTLYWGEQNNMLFADLIEAQSGFFNRAVLAKGLNTYLQLQEPSDTPRDYIGNCTQSGSAWLCFWPSLDLRTEFRDSTMKQIYLEIHGWDDAQNIFSQSVPIYIDTKPPEFRKIPKAEIKDAPSEIEALVVNTNNNFPAVIAGDSIKIEADFIDEGALKDDSGITYPSINLTMIEGGTGMRRADDCAVINKTIDNKNLWRCSWIVNNVASPGTAVKFDVNVSDITRNFELKRGAIPLIAYNDPAKGGEKTIVYVGEFKIEQRDINQTPNFWNYGISKISPPSVDRQILPFFNQLVYATISAQKLDNRVEAISLYLKGCDEDGTYDSVKMFYAGEFTMLEFMLAKLDLSEQKFLNYSCQIGTISRISGVGISQEEVDNISIEIPLYNMPLGKYDESIAQRIEWVKDWADNWFTKTLEVLNSIISYGQLFCNIYFIIGQIKIIINIIGSGTWKDLCMGIGFCAPAATAFQSVETTMDVNLGWFSKFASPICEFVYCTPAKESPSGDCSSVGTLQKVSCYRRKLIEVFGKYYPQASAVAARAAVGGQLPEFTGREIDFRDNLLLSFAGICLPGIVYNLNKYSQIVCTYGNCMIETSTKGGVSPQSGPVFACEQMYHEQMCIAITGDIFNLIPWANFIKEWLNIIKIALSDPASFLFFTAAMTCRITTPYVTTAYSVCTGVAGANYIINFIFGLINVFESTKSAFEGKFKIGEGACAQFNSAYDRLKEQEKKESEVT